MDDPKDIDPTAGGLKPDARALAEALPIPMALVRDEVVIFANAALARFLLHPDAASLEGAALSTLIAEPRSPPAGTGWPRHALIWLRLRNGGAVEVEAAFTPMADGSQDVQAIFQDTRVKRHLADTVKRTAQHLDDSQHIAKVTSWELDLATDELWWSAETYHQLGLNPGEMSPTLDIFFSMVHPEDRVLLESELDRLRTHGGSFDVEYRWGAPDHYDRTRRTIGKVANDEHGKPARLIGTGVDLTEKRLLEDSLFQARKMEAIGNLSSGIAHDFNNLLTVILCNAQLIEPSIQAGSLQAEALQDVLHATRSASSLTRKMLDIGRHHPLETEIFDLRDVIEGLRTMFERGLRDDVQLALSTTARPCLIKGERVHIEQLLLNLALNAQDAMPDGGTLAISISRSRKTRRRPSALKPKGRFAHLRVQDDGVGMDEQTRSKIFEPFFTTKDKQRGTGLGLATAYNAIRQHGGKVFVHSTPGEGTTFDIYLPLYTKGDSADPIDHKQL